MKKLWIVAVLALAFILPACRQSVRTPTQPAEPTLQPGETTLAAQDWREGAGITLRSTMLYGGEPVDVCVCVGDTEILIYRDAPEQEMLAQAGYPILLEHGEQALTACEFEDIDQDGYSELTANYTLPDGTEASFLWFWTEGEGYTLNQEFSRLPGEENR